MTFDTRKILSLLLIPIYLTLIVIFLILNIRTSFNPPILLLVFNSLFLGLIPLYVAYIAYKSFMTSGSNGVLLEGTGMLMLGLGAIGAGVVNYMPNSMNANVTVQNTGFCIAAFLQLIGILIALSGTAPRQRPGDASRISILYGGCVVVFCTFTIAAVSGSVPPFFIQGTGFTALREAIITSAIEFFVLAAGVLLWLYYKKREEFFFWYSIGMALIGIGLLAVHFPAVLGSPLGWVGRSAQYFGGVYLLIAFIALNRRSRRTGIIIEDMLSRFFSEAEEGYKILIETATDAIVVFDSAGRVIIWNRAAEKMFGYTSAEATGSSFFQMAIPDEYTDTMKSNFPGPVTLETDSSAHKSVEITARRKDGSTFSVELTLSQHIVAGARANTCIIRDITERKKAEEELIRKNEDLNAAFEEISAKEEELHQNIEELSRREEDLKQAVAEKEVLLSEIHHRVKNNLTAFISLLSLDGSYENSEEGQALRKDLQNRARSMALIHETLYRTRKFSEVDMETYLNPLIGQIAASYKMSKPVRIIIDASGGSLDLSRATTAGLIINELITNSFKYAFPPEFNCPSVRGEECTIQVSFTRDGDTYELRIADNGRGLPEGFNPLTAKSLGLKLVNFLASHQLRANISLQRDKGTTFIFRMSNSEVFI
jgi:PAS domain S-box-containing protein